MRILLDNCVDQKFKKLLSEYKVAHARDMGWALLENGDLIAQAEANGFKAIVTVDKKLRYQQNISNRKLSIIILDTPRITYRHLAPLIDQVMRALQNLREGAYITITPEKDGIPKS